MIVSAERISEGMDALEVKGRYERVERLAISLGLLPGGVANFIRKDAQRCNPAFLLVASLKGTMADQEIGDMLWEMLVQQGLETKPELRCSRQRMQGVVTSISSFCDSIIPRGVYDNVLRVLLSRNLSESEMKKALMKPRPQVLAEIYSRLFGSLSKAEIDKITIGGLEGCAMVAASLLWLKEGEIELTVGGELIQLTKDSRISLDLSTKYTDGWEVREWTRQEVLSEVIIPSSITDPRHSHLSLPGFLPASSAKNFIRNLNGFNGEQINVVGAVATAFAQLVLERWKSKGTRISKNALTKLKGRNMSVTHESR